MPTSVHLHPADIHGLALLATDATAGVTDIVEAMHEAIAWPPFLAPFRPSSSSLTIPGLVYSSVRGVARLVGGGVDLAFTPLVERLGNKKSTPQRDTFLGILGGVIGDHLADTGNPLAITMELRHGGVPLTLDRGKLHRSIPRASSRVAVFLHGLCGNDAQWKRTEINYTSRIQSDFDFTPVLLRYNSGRHVSVNGREFAGLLEALVREWPVAVEELFLVGHSMGGLVARSAMHQGREAGQNWPALVRRMVFLGTPHHGAPMERGGNWFEQTLGSVPYAAPLSRLGRLRSAGITDLRHGNLVDEDWMGRDRFEPTADPRRPLPLPDGVDCLAIAATTGSRRGDLRDRLVGDGIVPVSSALGHHQDPRHALALDDSRRILIPQANHMALLGHPEAWPHITALLKP